MGFAEVIGGPRSGILSENRLGCPVMKLTGSLATDSATVLGDEHLDGELFDLFQGQVALDLLLGDVVVPTEGIILVAR